MKIPKNLGRYEVLDLISQGGMGTLFRARDPRIGRLVAIKVLKRDFDTDELRDRFSREARAAGALSHPNIVTIFDVGEQDGLPFIAMEYVRGETFVEIIGLRPPLPVDRKLQLIEEVCAGLAHAHEAGIVHRDIKPANLILSSEGVVKILDFGIAKLSAAGLTMPGVIMGTLNYMSPEQAKGTPVDARTDIFAVGLVMYELLSHQPAFSGTRPSEVLHKILSGTPTPITQFCPDLDPRIVQVIDRAIQKNPDDRFPAIAEMQKAISAARMDAQSASASWPRPTRQTRSTASRPATDPARIRAEQIEEYLEAAARAFDAGDYDGATEACKQVLLLDASNERAYAELDRIHAAADERQAAVQAAVERGRAAFQGGNLMSALREVKQALALDPYDPDAQALSTETEQAIKERQEDARIRAAVDAARRRFAAGDHRAALQALEALQPSSSPVVRSAVDDLRRAMEQIEEQQRIETAQVEQRRRVAALAGDARAAIAANRLDEAMRIASQIREIDPVATEVADVTDRVRQAEATARAREEAGRTLADFETALRDGNLERADELLNAASALSPGDGRLPPARQQLADAKAAAARRRRGEEALDAAAARLQAGDLAAVDEMLTRAAELVPGDPRGVELAEQLRLARERQAAAEAAERLRREVEDLIRSASSHLQAATSNPAELPVALARVNRALELDAANADAARVKAAIDAAITARRDAARARAAIDNAGRRFANGKHMAAIKLLEEFDPPNHPDVVRALGQLRAALQVIEERRRAEQEKIDRRQRVDALVSDARAALGEQRFDDALKAIASAEEVDPAAAEIAPLKEQILGERTAAQIHADITARVAEIDERLAQGDLDAARDLLGRAAAVSAADPAIAAVRQRIDQAVAAREREAAAAREREATLAREREAALAREREAALAREREAALAREREAALAREREAALAREREAALAREREAAQPRSAPATPPPTIRDIPADPDAETLFAGDLQEAVRAALLATGRVPQASPAAAAGTVNPQTLVNPTADTSADGTAADAERARRTARNLLGAARAQLGAANPSVDDVTSALKKIEGALAAVPNDPEAIALETTANEALLRLRDTARIDAAIRNARSRFAIGKHQAAIQLLEGLDPASHPAVAGALKEFRSALQAMEDKRRQEEAARRRPQSTPADDATRVMLMPDVIGQRSQPDAGATLFVTGGPSATPSAQQPASPLAPREQADAPADSQRRLILFAGVLVAALLVALILLRFAS